MNPRTDAKTAEVIDGARVIADTVLFEGYMLYPYRANDAKNRVRWQFGVLAPPGLVAADPSERAFLQTDCLLEGHEVTVCVQVRFLHVQRRTVEKAAGSDFIAVESLDIGAATFLPWDEAVVHETTSTRTLRVSDRTPIAPRFTSRAAARSSRCASPTDAPSADWSVTARRWMRHSHWMPSRCPGHTGYGGCGCTSKTARAGARPAAAVRPAPTRCATHSSPHTCW